MSTLLIYNGDSYDSYEDAYSSGAVYVVGQTAGVSLHALLNAIYLTGMCVSLNCCLVAGLLDEQGNYVRVSIKLT